MSYFKDQIIGARHAFRETTKDLMLSGDEAFCKGLDAGFAIAVIAYGIWKSGRQRIGASDRAIEDCMEEFRSALKRTQPDTQKEDKNA